MLRAAIVFFVIGLVAMLLGATGFGGLSVEIGRTLLFVFLVLAVLSFLVSLFTGRTTRTLPAVLLAVGLGGLLSVPQVSGAAETTTKTYQNQESKKVGDSKYRTTKERVCEKVDGETVCTVKRVKDSVQRTFDKSPDEPIMNNREPR